MSIYYSTKTLANRLELSTRTLERYRLMGAGPAFVKLGKLIRYRPQDVEQWVESQLRKSTSDIGHD
jgi:predicted DNA-binding transcriptional regulator AlpA